MKRCDIANGCMIDLEDGRYYLADEVDARIKWRRVEDERPPAEVNFLSFSNAYGFDVSMYSNNPTNSSLLPTLDVLMITHWMPLPPVPDKDKG